MSEDAPKPRRRTSNHYKHGLTARKLGDRWFDEAEKIIDELIGDAPRTSKIVLAARSLTNQELLLRAIGEERRRLLTTPPPPTGYEEFSQFPDAEDILQDVRTSGFITEGPRAPWARQLIAYARYDSVVQSDVPTSEGTADLMRRMRRETQRLDEYERKARSRRMKLTRELDYLISEAWRRHWEQLRSRMSG